MSNSVTGRRCRELVDQWFYKQYHEPDPLDPPDEDVKELVRQTLLADRQQPQPDSTWIELLGKCRGGSNDAEQWSEAQPPKYWQQRWRISSRTWSRLKVSGKIVVDDRLSNKLVRIRLDTLRAIEGSK